MADRIEVCATSAIDEEDTPVPSPSRRSLERARIGRLYDRPGAAKGARRSASTSTPARSRSRATTSSSRSDALAG
jgi:hypothetical protein